MFRSVTRSLRATLAQLRLVFAYLLFIRLLLRLPAAQTITSAAACTEPQTLPPPARSRTRDLLVAATYCFLVPIVPPLLLLWLPPMPRFWYLTAALMAGLLGIAGLTKGLARLGFWQRLRTLEPGDHLTVLGSFVLAPFALFGPIRKWLVRDQPDLQATLANMNATQQILFGVTVAPWALFLLVFPVGILLCISPTKWYPTDALLAAGLLGLALFALFPNVPGAIAGILVPLIGPPYVNLARRGRRVAPATAVIVLLTLAIYLLVTI